MSGADNATSSNPSENDKPKQKCLWKIAFALGAVLYLNTYVPWKALTNRCVPLTDDIGYWSVYSHDGGWFGIWLRWSADGLDEPQKASTLFTIPPVIVQQYGGKVSEILESPSGFNNPPDIDGLVSLSSYEKQADRWHDTAPDRDIRYYGANYHIEPTGKAIWVKQPNALHPTFYLFDPSTLTSDGQLDWGKYLGRCPRLQQDAPRYDPENPLEFQFDHCDMEFWVGQVVVEYSVPLLTIDHFREVQSFIHRALLCKPER